MFVFIWQTVAAADTVYGQQSTEVRLRSDTADNIIWDRYTKTPNSNSPSTTSALSRINFDSADSGKPLHTVIDRVAAEQTRNAGSKNLIIVAGRSRRMAPESHKTELQALIQEKGGHIGSTVSKTLGDVGAALVATGTTASLLIMQAADP